MDTSFTPGRVYLRLRRLEEAAGSLNIFPRWEVYDHEGRHRAWWIKNKEKVPRLEVWVAVDFDSDFDGPKRTLCPTDLVVEQGAYTVEGKINTLIPGGIPVCAKLQRGDADATDELVRTPSFTNSKLESHSVSGCQSVVCTVGAVYRFRVQSLGTWSLSLPPCRNPCFLLDRLHRHSNSHYVYDLKY